MRKKRLSGTEFLDWIKMQLENREGMYGFHMDTEGKKEEVYKILFQEDKITVKEIEKYYIPFSQAGYLSPRRKFELMMFVVEKDYGKSCFLLDNPKERLHILTGQDIETAYLQWSMENRLILSDEEKREFFVQTITDQLGLGVLEVLQRVAMDGIFMGELCPALYEDEPLEQRIAICNRGELIHLPFLGPKTKEELIRIIKCAVAKENKGELTALEPVWDYVREDGTCITAMRPPGGANWGIRILYGAARKERGEWDRM